MKTDSFGEAIDNLDLALKDLGQAIKKAITADIDRYKRWRYSRTWEHGYAGPSMSPARRHRKKGNVQFVLWPAGEQGHEEDFWYDLDSSWWPTFISTNTAE